MASLEVKASDGKTLEVNVPDGTTPDKYGALADDALSHYTSQNQPSEGGIGSFLRGVGNQLPLGNQFAALVSKGPYSQNMQAINDATARDKAQNPVAYGGGAVAGTVAPAMVPGVGEAMAANPMTAGGILGGTGAISNTDIQKNPVQAAQQAGMGVATGTLLSGLLSKILPSQAGLEAKANTLANRSVNMPSGVLGDMTEAERQAQGSALRDAGVVVSDKQKALDKANELLTNYGKKIGEVGKTAEGQGLVADPEQHYGAITNLLDKAQGFEGSANKVSKAIGRDYKAGATDLASLGDNPSFQAIQSLKEKYGKFAFKDNATQGAKDTYFALSNMLKGIADKAQSNPALGDQYKEALAGYSQMAPVVDGLESSVDAELRGSGAGLGARGLAGLVRKMPGPLRAVAGPIAVATGHPIIGLGAALPEIMNPALQSQASGALASAMPAIQNVGTEALSNASSTPQAQAKIADLIQQLKAKYAQRARM